MKTPEDMYNEGWCKDCDYCFKKCLNKGVCKGYSLEEEEDETEESI